MVPMDIRCRRAALRSDNPKDPLLVLDHPLNLIISRKSPASGGHHGQYILPFPIIHCRESMRGPHQITQAVFAKPIAHSQGAQKLHQHIESAHHGTPRLNLPLCYGTAQGCCFEQFQSKSGQEMNLALRPWLVSTAPRALNEPRHPLGSSNLYNRLNRTEVNTQVERTGAHNRFEPAVVQRVLYPEPQVLADAAVVQGHRP